jgi:NADPH-dependent F420 reductase
MIKVVLDRGLQSSGMEGEMMKIAVIGTGNVGSVLGRRWAELGHEVIFGTRDPGADKIERLLASIEGNARASLADEAVSGADIVLLAVPWPAAEQVVRSLGSLEGKILIDATNPIAPGMQGLSIGCTTSGGEQVSAWAEGARVVKAFNTTGAGNMADPQCGSDRVTMYVAGDDKGAKAVVIQLAEALGFEADDVGPLRAARYLEPLAMLWVHLAYVEGWGPEFAFRTIRR